MIMALPGPLGRAVHRVRGVPEVLREAERGGTTVRTWGNRTGAKRRREAQLQSVEADVAMTTPGGFGDAPLPKRNGHRGMLPSTWLNRSLRIGYIAVDGTPVETSGIYLDHCGAGPVFNFGGSRHVICWDRLVALELVND